MHIEFLINVEVLEREEGVNLILPHLWTKRGHNAFLVDAMFLNVLFCVFSSQVEVHVLPVHIYVRCALPEEGNQSVLTE